ncbi:MAG: IS66 family insertion sequence element accessory protein TnpB [Halioglobus sp.]|nr:IS66 family insertion sequence element accessory protein TnpB [Halioglobus sp.]
MISGNAGQALPATAAQFLRVDAIWLATAPMDMRAGPDTALARVVQVFGEARAHHAYLFANKRGNRVKILLHDGMGLWLLARRLNEGRFKWARPGQDKATLCLSEAQVQALLVGLPWQHLSDHAITVV